MFFSVHCFSIIKYILVVWLKAGGMKSFYTNTVKEMMRDIQAEKAVKSNYLFHVLNHL